MASRDYIRNTVSDSSLTNARLGDEQFNPTTNRFYKRLAINGTAVTDVEIPALISGNLLISTGTINDPAGNVRDLVNHSQGSAYTLTRTDNGKMINITTGGVTVNTDIFSAGNNVTIFNNSAVSQTITQGTGVTMYLAGTSTTGTRTLAQRGIATIVCVAANTFVISGAGLS